MFEALNVETNVPLAAFTTLKIGGPAKYFLRAKKKSDVLAGLSEARQNNLPVFILGGGSDILVHDLGFPGLVIKMENNQIDITGTMLTAGSGTLLNAAINFAVRSGLAGLEFATGVPATVGGAVWANLGTRNSDISTVIARVHFLDENLEEQTFSAKECQFGYRDSIFKHKRFTIIEVDFALTPGDKDSLRSQMVELSKLKKIEQNVGEDTAGCAFRNPPDSNKTAAQHIDELGLKGYKIGGAQISNQHANFIVNTGEATADNVVQLISYIKQQVRDKHGIQLMEEIEYTGFNQY